MGCHDDLLIGMQVHQETAYARAATNLHRVPVPARPALLRARSVEIILSSVASAGCLFELAGLLAGLAHMPMCGRPNE